MAKGYCKLLLDRFCQQATQGSWIDDIEAEQGWPMIASTTRAGMPWRVGWRMLRS
jgi:hypothetical protein